MALELELVSDFVVSDEDGAALLDDEDDAGALLEPDEDGVLLEPLAAEPLGVELELDGAVVDEDEDEPPLALSFFVFRSIEVDEELEPDGELVLGDVVPEADEDEDGVLGVAVVPLADEDDEPGVVVAPDGEVVDDELDERSAARSHAVISVAPSAIETATAIVDSLMWPPWLGYWNTGANIGPALLKHYPIGVRATSVALRLRTLGVVARLEVAPLFGLLRIDLLLMRVRAFALLRGARRAGARRAGIRRCRSSGCGLWNGRRRVGFRRRRRSGIAIARREGEGEGNCQGNRLHNGSVSYLRITCKDGACHSRAVPCAP